MRETTWTEERRIFRNLFDNADVMAWMTEPDGYSIYLSPAWYRFTGCTPGTAEGYGWARFLHEDDHAASEIAYLKAMEAENNYEFDFRLLRRDGEYVLVSGKGTLQRDQHGTLHTIFGVIYAVDGSLAARSTVVGNVADKITPRQREVLELIVSGHTNKAIGNLLGISQRTVELHRAAVMDRLGAKNLVHLVTLAAIQPSESDHLPHR